MGDELMLPNGDEFIGDEPMPKGLVDCCCEKLEPPNWLPKALLDGGVFVAGAELKMSRSSFFIS